MNNIIKIINILYKNKFYFFIIISLSFLFISLFFILMNFFQYKKINNDINFIEFLKNNIIKIIVLDLNNKRIIKHQSSKRLLFHSDKFIDDGYILFSGYDVNFKTAVTSLFSIKNNKILHRWIPPIKEIHLNSPDYIQEYNLKKNYRMQHPLMNYKGDLIFSSGEGPLVKVDKCGKLVWTINRHFHHSIERYKDSLLIAPIILNNKTHHEFPFLDHGFALIDEKSGKITKEFSIMKILEDNNQIGLIYGVGEFEYDRVHLNDAEPILEDDLYFNKGDVMLSSKHLSTVLLYRPKDNKILWIKTGPWLNQHDIDYLGDGIFTIFGNDTFRYNEVETHDIFYNGNNNIYSFDSNNHKIIKLFTDEMKNIRTPTQGLHQILSNGDLFIEESDKFKIYRIGDEGVIWEFINRIDSNRIGSIHWSRYLNNKTDLNWLSKITC